MEKVVRVRLKEQGPSYYYLATVPNLQKNTEVLVETESGIHSGMVVSGILEMDTSLLEIPLKKIIRILTKKDRKILEKNRVDAKKSLEVAKKLAIKENLDISFVDAYFTYNREQLLLQFISNNRVDFRSLAKALAGKYKTRIELRQIGVRDKAKKIGGIANCGQQLCCNRFLEEFDSVSINMAKNQNIALNPSKINGLCGRLLCCLKYENNIYTENRKELPKLGSTIEVEEGEGKVVGIDVLKKTYTVDIPTVGQVVKTVDHGSN